MIVKNPRQSTLLSLNRFKIRNADTEWFSFSRHFSRRQQRPRKTISKRPWRVIVNAMAYTPA